MVLQCARRPVPAAGKASRSGAHSHASPSALEGTAHEVHFWRNYGAGLLLMAGHVQAMLFYAALLPGFVDFDGLTVSDLGLIALMLVVVIGGMNAGYALLAARARGFFADARAQRMIYRVAGTLMLVAAVACRDPV